MNEQDMVKLGLPIEAHETEATVVFTIYPPAEDFPTSRTQNVGSNPLIISSPVKVEARVLVTYPNITASDVRKNDDVFSDAEYYFEKYALQKKILPFWEKAKEEGIRLLLEKKLIFPGWRIVRIACSCFEGPSIILANYYDFREHAPIP